MESRSSCALTVVLLTGTLLASVPRQISYQGVLTTGSGSPVPDGSHALTLSLYDTATGGVPLWSEFQTVSTKAGVFSIALGDSTAGGIPIPFDKPYWLGVKVGASEVVPRTRLSAASYSMRTALADSAVRLRSVFVDDNGRVGIGTAAPETELHVKGNVRLNKDNELCWRRSDVSTTTFFAHANDTMLGIRANTGSNPGLFLRMSGNVGIGTATPGKLLTLSGSSNPMLCIENPNISLTSLQQTAFNHGSVPGLGPNAGGVLSICNNGTGGLWFRSVNNAASSGLGAYFSSSSENDLTTYASFYLRAEKHSGSGSLVAHGDAARIMVLANNSTELLTVLGSGNVGVGTSAPDSSVTVAGGLHVTGGSLLNHLTYTTGGSTSDLRFKTDVCTIRSALSTIDSLRGVTYSWNRAACPERDFPEGRQIGMLAQEVEKVLPELVHTDAEGYKSMSYDRMSAVLVEAVKELKTTAALQARENDSLKAQISALQLRIAGVEAQLAR